MARKNKYSEYSKVTQSFMNAVENHLINKFGELETQWEGLLIMLATQYELFNQCKEQIKTDGLMVKNRFGGWDKHPLLKSMTDAQIQTIKMVQEFGISPKSIKGLGTTDNNEDEFLNSLTGED